MDLRSILATRLVQLRLKNNLTQQQLADACHRSAGWVRGYEQQTRWPDPEDLELLAKVLGVDAIDLLTHTQEQISKDMTRVTETDGISKVAQVFSANCKRLRGSATQQEIADRAGLSLRSYQSAEYGRLPHEENLKRIASAFEVDEIELFQSSNNCRSNDKGHFLHILTSMDDSTAGQLLKTMILLMDLDSAGISKINRYIKENC